MTMNADPAEVIDQSAMKRGQIIVVVITVFLNALDGFDLLSISFAAPGISAEWGIDRVALGLVLSMELIGMGIGSLLLGGVADRFGRRRTVLACLVVMTVGMFMVTTAQNVVMLSIWRVLTGLGIGGMLAATNALAAEFSNQRRRHLAVACMALGYPIGGILGGSVASVLLGWYDWRSVFYLGAAVTLLFIPMVYFLVPESVQWLARKQPENALERVNGIMRKLGHAAVSALPTLTEAERNKSVTDIFSPEMRRVTLLVLLTYFFHVTTFYFILKWLPKIVVDMGFSAAAAGGSLVWANVGGAAGGAVFGLLTLRFGLKPLMMCILAGSFICVVAFGQAEGNLQQLTLMAAVAGFFSNAGMVGMYAVMAHAFPTHARAFGTGFTIGLGRIGSIVSPVLAGYLFSLELGLPTVATYMAVGSLLAALVFSRLTLRSS
jgi:benzoate transport